MWDLPGSSSRSWPVPASLALLAALFGFDLVAGDDPVLVPAYVLAPLLAALAARPRVLAVAFGGALAVWAAELRGRATRVVGALRTQTDRYETLLTALSEAGEG